MLYKVVKTMGDVDILTLEELKAKYNVTGYTEEYAKNGYKGICIRVELQGQPKLSDFLGPMYDEYEGQACCRYESDEVYELLSC